MPVTNRPNRMSQLLVFGLQWVILATAMIASPAIADEKPEAESEAAKPAVDPVSYYRKIRPILQRHCSGCHQPLKNGGKLLLTSYEGFRDGGESGPGFEPGKPDESLIIDFITGDEPLMPQEAAPLSEEQIDLVTRWIAEGAVDDTPAGLADTISPENPPQYSSPPVISALAYSPDSKMLAVSGYREILLHNADGGELIGRLVGRSQRIESVAFSPDGKLIGAAGGTPFLFGEVQFWDPKSKELVRSINVSFDTLFGGSFSDDGKMFAVGGADKRARVFNVEDGEQIMQLDAHADWVLATTFSKKLTHLITVSRDMAMKLTIIATAQFVDNITSITPGALKGGLMDIERHPQREQVLTGGSDGEPKLYQIFRTKARRIGDDFNKIRAYAALPGRVVDLDFNKDGSKFVVGASTATSGSARIYDTEKSKPLHELKGHSSPVYAVAFRPDGKQVATGGFDGVVRIFDVETGELVKEFEAVELTDTQTAAK